MLGIIDILIFVMKTTINRKTNEITFHVNVSEMIDCCFEHLRSCIESHHTSQQQQLSGIEYCMKVITTLKSGNTDAIIKMFKKGDSSTMVPDLSVIGMMIKGSEYRLRWILVLY